jgi:hypothetical protein
MMTNSKQKLLRSLRTYSAPGALHLEQLLGQPLEHLPEQLLEHPQVVTWLLPEQQQAPPDTEEEPQEEPQEEEPEFPEQEEE